MRSYVAGTEAFREKIRRLGELVAGLDALPGDKNAAARELVQLLLDVHGTALQRMMEIVFDSGPAGKAIILKTGEDPIVRHLLLLHSLHPEELDSRVMKALDAARPKLRKLNSEVELVSLSEGVVQVKVNTSGHTCGSTVGTVKTLVEECIYDQAPDVESLQFIEPDEVPSTGFVSIDKLLKNSVLTSPMAERGVEVCGAD
jgi:Fe-S cluster biogenesis protein NfuA